MSPECCLCRVHPYTGCVVCLSLAADMTVVPKNIFSYVPRKVKRAGAAPFLPMSKKEMDILGWDACDIIIVSGDAYIDHPSFGASIIGRVLEAQAQPAPARHPCPFLS